jgi:hypothetical protein
MGLSVFFHLPYWNDNVAHLVTSFPHTWSFTIRTAFSPSLTFIRCFHWQNKVRQPVKQCHTASPDFSLVGTASCAERAADDADHNTHTAHAHPYTMCREVFAWLHLSSCLFGQFLHSHTSASPTIQRLAVGSFNALASDCTDFWFFARFCPPTCPDNSPCKGSVPWLAKEQTRFLKDFSRFFAATLTKNSLKPDGWKFFGKFLCL